VSARRRNEVAAVVDDVPQKGMVEIFMDRHKDNLELLAPFVGAAVGAMALEAASQHVAMKRHEIALVGAGLAFLTGANAKGPMRQLAMGAAAGAACYGVVEVLRQIQPEWLYEHPQPESAPRQAAPPDAMTRTDLKNALAQLNRRHQAELAAVEAAHVERMREMKQSYEAHIGEMQSAIHALLNELRRERGEPIREPASTSVADTNVRPQVTAEESSRAVPSNDTAPPKTASIVPTPTRASIEPDQAAHFAAIYGLLTAEERKCVSALIAGASPTMLAAVQRDLLSMTPERAVTHLRRNFFPSGAAA
jgi:hypothetical protein